MKEFLLGVPNFRIIRTTPHSTRSGLSRDCCIYRLYMWKSGKSVQVMLKYFCVLCSLGFLLLVCYCYNFSKIKPVVEWNEKYKHHVKIHVKPRQYWSTPITVRPVKEALRRSAHARTTNGSTRKTHRISFLALRSTHTATPKGNQARRTLRPQGIVQAPNTTDDHQKSGTT